MVEAIKKQADSLIHGPMGIVMHDPILELAQRLPSVMPQGMESFFFGNSGTEAVEGAVKLAKYVTGRPVVLGFLGGFHGRTYFSATLTASNSAYRRGCEPLVGAVYHAPFAYCYRCPVGRERSDCSVECLSGLERIFDHLAPPDQVAAMLVEPIQGEGGFVVPPPAFLQGLRRICDEHGILLIFDEIQVGFGRTGHMFAADAFDVRPDIMCIAKAMASGMPLSATVASREIMSKWAPGTHGTTFGGNPLSAAAGMATLDILTEPGFLEAARARGERLGDGLKELAGLFPDIITDVRGLGLIYGVEFADLETKKPRSDLAAAFARGCLERGLLLYPAGRWGQVVRLMPPLVATVEEMDEALDIVRVSLEDLQR